MNSSDCFLIDEVENKLVISNAKPKKNVPKSKTIEVTSDSKFDEFKVETKDNAAIETVFEDYFKSLSLINLNDKQMDSILKCSETLIKNYSEVLGSSLKNDSDFTLVDKADFLCQKFNERNTKKKRLKFLEENSLFVAAEKNTIGIKWKCKLDSTKDIPNHYLAHNDFSYTSIKETIKSAFKRPEFEDVYLSYNLNKKHKCTEGAYEDYCCGKNAKMCPLFDDPRTLQIEIFTDDFEVCSGLKTKTVKHNVTGVYFRIRNLPAEYNSRLDNIHLIALAKAQDIKDGVSFDNIAKRIVAEIRELQYDGIQLDSGLRIKGTLINIIADNLGANAIFGLVKCFNTDGFCRICQCTKLESETQTNEVAELMRREENYLDLVEIAKDGDLKKSKGIKNYCLFNDLDYFHIFQNNNIDIMHDVNEGVLHVVMKLIFETLLNRTNFKKNDIVAMVRDHNYGKLCEKNKPSKLILTKRNFNQNATQSYNLFLNLPFIFYEKRDSIATVWSIIESLLKILQIIYSTKITERNLNRLRDLIPTFLSELVDHGVKLTPKLHNMTHYATVIQNMGPLIHMSAMRMEAKHKTFTQIAHNTNCFKNITETLASRHQQIACLKNDMFVDNIIASKRKIKLHNSPNVETYKMLNILTKNLEKSDSLEFLKINAFEYRKGYVLLIDGFVFEIVEILNVNNDFFFLCSLFKVNEFNDRLNSINISKLNEYKLIGTADNWPKPYEKKVLRDKLFVIANNLSVYDDF